MKKAIAILLIALLVLSFAGCKKKEKSPLVGTWTDEYGQSYTFNDDGTASYDNGYRTHSMTYSVDGDKLTLKNTGSDDDTSVYTFRIEGNTLNLTTEYENLTYTKK